MGYLYKVEATIKCYAVVTQPADTVGPQILIIRTIDYLNSISDCSTRVFSHLGECSTCIRVSVCSTRAVEWNFLHK